MQDVPLFPSLTPPDILERPKSLEELLSEDLNFLENKNVYGAHNYHSFPAKFPPQLPRKFIYGLTRPGDVVLDPMNGSGTTTVEAVFAGREAIGFDIDPLAIRIARVKMTPLDTEEVLEYNRRILNNAFKRLQQNRSELEKTLSSRWDQSTAEFVNYWFAQETQLELIALVLEIERISDPDLRVFFELVFSSIIITKTGGVSLALDLAHTRPHRAKVVMSRSGGVLMGKEFLDESGGKGSFFTKVLRSPFEEFNKRVATNVKSLAQISRAQKIPKVVFGNAQSMPLPNDCIDLIITSPPYASNAIDYMRAHKFSLVWFGLPIDNLSRIRSEYIGNDATTGINYEPLPSSTNDIVEKIKKLDQKKGLALHRYYSEMARTIQEMYRVLKPGKAAIVVVGTSVLRGVDTETHNCLAEIGEQAGFGVPKIGVRNLDRNRRMMPVGNHINFKSQIQQRMHEEFVIGFMKAK